MVNSIHTDYYSRKFMHQITDFNKKKKKSEKLPPSLFSKHESAKTLKHLVFLYSV